MKRRSPAAAYRAVCDCGKEGWFANPRGRYCSPQCKSAAKRRNESPEQRAHRLANVRRNRLLRSSTPEGMAEERRQARLRQKWTRYRLTHRAYALLVLWQRGQCALCDRAKPLHIDHDHATGLARGLLCQGCNNALGGFEDNRALVSPRVVRYLDYPPAQQAIAVDRYDGLFPSERAALVVAA